MKRKFYKQFGKAKEEDNYTLEVTTWDGENSVLIIFPKKMTKKIKEDVGDFLLSELDDHDCYDKFVFLCDMYYTSKARKRNLKVKK